MKAPSTRSQSQNRSRGRLARRGPDRAADSPLARGGKAGVEASRAHGPAPCAHIQMQSSCGDIHLDPVTGPNKGQRPHLRPPRRHMKNDRAVAVPLMRASEMRIMSRTPFSSSLRGRPMFPTSAIPGYPFGPQFCRTRMQLSSTIKSRVVDARVVVLRPRRRRPRARDAEKAPAMRRRVSERPRAARDYRAGRRCRLPRGAAHPTSGSLRVVDLGVADLFPDCAALDRQRVRV